MNGPYSLIDIFILFVNNPFFSIINKQAIDATHVTHKGNNVPIHLLTRAYIFILEGYFE